MIDSEGTVIIYFTTPSGGTGQTLMFCIKERRPYLLIDAEELSTEQAIKRTVAFINQHSIRVLNFAGPRAGGEPRAYEYTYRFVTGLLQSGSKVRQ